MNSLANTLRFEGDMMWLDGEAGRGYQSLINDTLRAALSRTSAPVDEATLRKVLREELHATG